MRNFRLFLFFLSCLLTTALSAQEICDNGIDDDGDGLIDLQDSTDCACLLVSTVESFFVNPSFEEFSNDENCGSSQTNGAPDGPGQADCIASWEQSSDATTDAWHLLTYNGNPPNWPGSIPQPFPSGVAVAGFFVGVSTIPEYREYLGACLPPGSIQEGIEYRLNLYLGFGDITGNGVDSLIYSPPLELAIYGITDCNLLRFEGRECPEVAGADGWELITTATLAGAAGTWENFNLDFTPSRDYAAIAIGGACTAVSGPPGASFWRRYYFVDDLILNTRAAFENTPTVGTVAIVGNDICDEDTRMEATLFPDATYQWYRNNIAIVGATDRAYFPPLDEHFPGLYSVRISRPDGCGIAGPVDLIRPVVTSAFRDSVYACPDGEAVIQPTIRGTLVQSYLWEDGSTEGTRIVTSPGTYTVTITSFCEQTVETVVVTNAVQPSFEVIAVPANYCQGDTVTVYLRSDWELSLIASDAVASYRDSFRLVITNELQTFSVVAFSNCFFSGELFYEFGLPEVIDPDFQPVPLSCSNVSTSLSPSIVGDLVNPIFTWRNEAGQIVGSSPSIVVDNAGDYSLLVSADNLSCENEATFTVSFSDTDRFVSLAQLPVLSCANASGEIIVVAQQADQTIFLWTDASGTLLGNAPTLTVNTPGQYTLRAYLLTPNSNDTICSQIDVFNVLEDIDQPLIINQTTPILTCSNPVASIVIQVDNPARTQFLWTNDNGQILGTNDSLLVGDPANYNLLVYILADNGDTLCQERSQIPVTLLSNFDFSFATEVEDNCTGASTASVDFPGPVEEWNFTWVQIGNNTPLLSGSGANTLAGLTPGNYRVRFQQNQYCRGEANFTIEAIEELRLSLAFQPIPCPLPEDVDRLASLAFQASGGTPPYRYLLAQGDTLTTDLLADIGPGTYSAQVLDAFGCVAESEAVTLAEPVFLLVEAGPDQRIDLGTSTRLNAQTNQAVPTEGLLWSPAEGLSCTDCPSPTANPFVSTDYRVTYFTTEGCAVSDVVRVGVVPTGRVYIPNAFSPNGDGVNDLFQLFPDQSVAEVLSLQVFNRWGGLVFTQDNTASSRGWEGLGPDGQPSAAGVYAYTAEVRLLNGDRLRFEGSINLLR